MQTQSTQEPPDQFSRSIETIQDQVTSVVQKVESWLSSKEISEEYIGNIALVLAEAVNNVIEHAYEYATDGQIEISVWIHEDMVFFRLTDEGHEMKELPEKKKMTGHLLPIEGLPEGGFGWFLIHSLSQEITYVRNGHRNELSICVLEDE